MPTSAHAIRSADRVIRLLGKDAVSIDRLSAAFRTHPSDGEFATADLWRGADLLVELCLATKSSHRFELTADALAIGLSTESIVLLLERWLTHTQPLWLSLAVSEADVVSELVPEAALKLVSRCTTSDGQRDELLLAMAAKVDAARRAQIGEAGEIAVVRAAKSLLIDGGRDELASIVEQVSLISDSLGYDVLAPGFDTVHRHLEVKTSASAGSHRFFISRNEFNRGLRDPYWFIVVCHLVDDDGVVVEGWLPVDRIAALMPRDAPGGARWESAGLKYAPSMVEPGLPL